jgi:sugar phosphate isomerase/epimerase
MTTQTLSRRDFGKATLGALGAFTVGSVAPLSARKAPSSVFGGVQIGPMTYRFRDRPLDKALENIVDIGFSSVELYSRHLDPLKATDDEIRSCKEKFAGAGVRIASYYVEMGDDPGDTQIDRCFEVARLLGVNILSSSLTKPLVPRVDKACARHRTYLGLHNHWFNPPDSKQFQDPQDFDEALKNSSPWLSITLDVGHFHAAGQDPVEFIAAHRDRIVSLHLTDRGDDPRHIDHPFGEGDTPNIAVVQLLKKIDYKHAANIEWEVENADPYKGVKDGLAYFKNALA